MAIYVTIDTFNNKYGLVRSPVKGGDGEESLDSLPPTMSDTKYEMLYQSFLRLK